MHVLDFALRHASAELAAEASRCAAPDPVLTLPRQQNYHSALPRAITPSEARVR